MGNRSYLYLKDSKETICLFEANNSLPFFWIGLLNQEILKKTYQNWLINIEKQKNFSEVEYESFLISNSNTITLDRETLEENSKKTESFLQKNFPNIIPLYKDFILYLNEMIDANKKIKIDFVEFANFFDSIDDLYVFLCDELRAIEKCIPSKNKLLNVNDLIASGTGFESNLNSTFSKSINYQESFKARTHHTILKEKKFSLNTVIIQSIILIICPFFSYLIYLKLIEDGFSFIALFSVLVNLSFYIFSIFKISKEIKSYQINNHKKKLIN